MKKQAKLIIGSDFSEFSNNAIEVGLEWGKILHFDPYIVHISPAKGHPDVAHALDEKMEQKFEELAEGIREDLEKKLNDQIKKCGGDKEVVSRSKILFGDKNEILFQEAEGQNAKLLILGTQGQSKLQDIILGGTTERAIRWSPCPVLTVRDRKVKQPTTIFWTTELGETSSFVFEWVRILASTFNSKVVIGHVSNSKLEYTDESNELLDQYMVQLEKEGLEVELDISKKNRVNPSKPIIDMIEKWKPDLVVMGTHARRGVRRLFMGSVAEEVTHKVNRSFLIVKVPR